MRRSTTVLVLALAFSAPARAQEISLEEIAQAEHEEQLALDRVQVAHGNKPPQELSAEERAQIIHEQQAASREVYQRRSLDPKAFAGRVMRLSPQERAKVNAEKKRMEEEELRAREAAAASQPEEVEITRGIDEKHPVDVYREPGAVEVENLQEEGGGTAAEQPAPKTKKAASKQKSSRGGKSRHK